MIIGINTSYEFQGKAYHIQIEDLGEDQKSMEIRVYNQGHLVWQKRIPYQPNLVELKSSIELSNGLKFQMDKLLATVKAGIDQGKIKATS